MASNSYKSKHTGVAVDTGIYKTKFMGYYEDGKMYNPTLQGAKPLTSDEKDSCLMNLTSGVYQDIATGSLYAYDESTKTLIKKNNVTSYAVTGTAADGTEAFASAANEIFWTQSEIQLADKTTLKSRNLAIGDNIFVEATETSEGKIIPDRWVSAIFFNKGGSFRSATLSRLETQSIDIEHLAYTNAEHENRFAGKNSFIGVNSGVKDKNGVFLGLDQNNNANIDIVSTEGSSYIDFSKAGESCDFRIIKNRTDSNTDVEFIHGNYVMTLPNNNGTIALISDLTPVYNATLTIQKNGTSVGTFTANASSNNTINITVPTALSDLTGDATHKVVTDDNITAWNNKEDKIPTIAIGTSQIISSPWPTNADLQVTLTEEQANICKNSKLIYLDMTALGQKKQLLTKTEVSATSILFSGSMMDASTPVHDTMGNLIVDINLTTRVATASSLLLSRAEKTSWDNKQAALVSGTNIKTINNNSLLGSGNITVGNVIQGGTPWFENIKIFDDNGDFVNEWGGDDNFDENDVHTIYYSKGICIEDECTLAFPNKSGTIALVNDLNNIVKGASQSYTIQVVTSLPANPDPNTIYLVEVQ